MKNKFILATVLTACILCSQAQAQSNRSKYISAGDVLLMFEIPENMCFVDTDSRKNSSLHNSISSQVEASKEKKLLAAFVECLKISRYREDPSKTSNGSMGIISWLNPEIGFTYAGSRKQFLDKMERKYNNVTFKRFKNSIVTYIKHTQKIDDKMVEDLAMIGYTTIKHVPVEIRIKDTSGSLTTDEMRYKFINAFINYQIKMNE